MVVGIGSINGGDYWILKLSSAGSVQWQKHYGGSVTECAKSIHQTLDGGFVIAGSSGSGDGDVIGNHGGVDFWILKLTSSGTLQWKKCFGGSAAVSCFAYPHS